MKKNKNKMTKVKGFGYHVIDDADVIAHIDKQPNKSRYIWDLVRKDMSELDDIDIKIKKCIEKYLSSYEIKLKDKKEVEINEDVIFDILNLKE